MFLSYNITKDFNKKYTNVIICFIILITIIISIITILEKGKELNCNIEIKNNFENNTNINCEANQIFPGQIIDTLPNFIYKIEKVQNDIRFNGYKNTSLSCDIKNVTIFIDNEYNIKFDSNINCNNSLSLKIEYPQLKMIDFTGSLIEYESQRIFNIIKSYGVNTNVCGITSSNFITKISFYDYYIQNTENTNENENKTFIFSSYNTQGCSLDTVLNNNYTNFLNFTTERNNYRNYIQKDFNEDLKYFYLDIPYKCNICNYLYKPFYSILYDIIIAVTSIISTVYVFTIIIAKYYFTRRKEFNEENILIQKMDD